MTSTSIPGSPTTVTRMTHRHWFMAALRATGRDGHMLQQHKQVCRRPSGVLTTALQLPNARRREADKRKAVAKSLDVFGLNQHAVCTKLVQR